MKLLRLLLLLALLVPAARAHVGSKDVFEQVSAGPYQLFVTVRPPNVIPGVATVEVRTSGPADVNGLLVTPLPLTGEGALHPPTGDRLTRSAVDPHFFSGGVWIMAPGSWQVRFEATGAAGPQLTSVPVLAVPIATLRMERGLGLGLAALGLLLVVGMAGIATAAIGQSRLAPGQAPTSTNRRHGLTALAASLVVMVLAVYLGAKWWKVEAAGYAGDIYTRPTTTATLTGDRLDLRVQPVPNEDEDLARSNDDFLPDHGHLIHLYAIRLPDMDAAFHLHPQRAAPGDFRMNLPVMPPGHYLLYGDVVHADGFPETLTTAVDVPENLGGTPLAPEDAEALPSPLTSAPLGSSYKLPDGYTMVWDRPDPAPLAASHAYILHFRLVDPAGKPATGMQPYLGMAGHAAFVKTDGSVFAHTHPEGSAAMAALTLANGDNSMEGMDMGPLAPAVDFPYGFPTPGNYRIFIQMKHAGTVETGVFDASVK
jgi:hypothetical protein